jgi:hypothetical protein
MKTTICLLIFISAVVFARGSCGYTEGTGGGLTCLVDTPTYVAWSYKCDVCTATDNYTECFGTYPHWTFQAETYNADTGTWDVADFGSCDEPATFKCVDLG